LLQSTTNNRTHTLLGFLSVSYTSEATGMPRLLLLLYVCGLTLAVASPPSVQEKDLLSQRILEKAAATPVDANFVTPEIVDNVHSPNPKPVDMVALEADSTVSSHEQRLARSQVRAGFMPGASYPAAYPGYYGAVSGPQGMMNAAFGGVSPFRFQAGHGHGAPGGVGAHPVPPNAYGQYGFPYSSYAPIPPPMPTYLPPPPYIPLTLDMTAAGMAGAMGAMGGMGAAPPPPPPSF